MGMKPERCERAGDGGESHQSYASKSRSVTVLLLGENAMTKAAYSRKGLFGGRRFQRDRSRSSSWPRTLHEAGGQGARAAAVSSHPIHRAGAESRHVESGISLQRSHLLILPK